jgi:hypothetical protein
MACPLSFKPKDEQPAFGPGKISFIFAKKRGANPAPASQIDCVMMMNKKTINWR